MAKKSMIEREKKRIKLNKKYQLKRQVFSTESKKYQKNPSAYFDGKARVLHYNLLIQQLPKNSSKIRIRNRCWKTGRPRGFYRDFGVSRHVLREMAHKCLLPGLTKSSW